MAVKLKRKIRILKFVLPLAVVGIGLALSILARIYVNAPSRDELTALIAQSWHDATKDTMRFSGDVDVGFFPRPHLTITSANLETGSGASIKAGTIRLDFEFASSLQSQYKITSVRIDDGDIILPPSLRPSDKTGTKAFLQSLFGVVATATNRTDQTLFHEAQFAHTRIRFPSDMNEAPVDIENATITLGNTGAFLFDGRANYKSEAFSLRLAFESRDPQLRTRPTRFDYRDQFISLTGQGSAAFEPEVQFVGEVSLATNELERALEYFIGLKTTPLLGKAKMQSQARLAFSAFTLADMAWTIGNTKLSGNMMADFARLRPRITTTLAATQIDVTSFSDQYDLKNQIFGTWSKEPFKSIKYPDLDLDMRLSAELVTDGDLTVKSVAISSLLQDQKLEVSLVSADMFDGSLSGKITLASDHKSEQHAVNVALEFGQIDLERGMIAFLDTKRVSGSATGRLQLSSRGNSIAELAGNLDGKIGLDIAHASVSGVNLLNFLHRIETRPLGATVALKGGNTDFDTAQINLVIEKGIGNLRNANLTRLPDLQIKLNGDINFVRQDVMITGHALGSSAQNSDQAINLPFALKGPFDNLAFLPDFMNITKQSGMITP